MKKITFGLTAVSVVLNVTLAALLVVGLSGAGSVDSGGAASTADVSQTPPTAQPKIDPDVWPGMQTDDPPTLVARLRMAGFPAQIIRAILSARLGDEYIARRKALDPEEDTRPFWKIRQPDPQRDLAMRKLGREHEKMLRDLLGEEGTTVDPWSEAYQQRQLAGVPAEKINDVRQLMRDYDEKRSDIYMGGTINADRDKLNALEKAQHAALAQILTPAELADYDLRNSLTANRLRFELTAFNASEAEFRQIFALKQPFDERFNLSMMYGTSSPEEMRARNEAQKQLTEQIKDALGPVRGEEYVRATDYNYRQASQLIARLDLPPETTNQIWELQKDIQQRSQALNADRAMPADQKATQLAALAEEAKTTITATLGDRGFEAYKQYGGQWMQSLQPRPAGPAGWGGMPAVIGNGQMIFRE